MNTGEVIRAPKKQDRQDNGTKNNEENVDNYINSASPSLYYNRMYAKARHQVHSREEGDLNKSPSPIINPASQYYAESHVYEETKPVAPDAVMIRDPAMQQIQRNFDDYESDTSYGRKGSCTKEKVISLIIVLVVFLVIATLIMYFVSCNFGFQFIQECESETLVDENCVRLKNIDSWGKYRDMHCLARNQTTCSSYCSPTLMRSADGLVRACECSWMNGRCREVKCPCNIITWNQCSAPLNSEETKRFAEDMKTASEFNIDNKSIADFSYAKLCKSRKQYKIQFSILSAVECSKAKNQYACTEKKMTPITANLTTCSGRKCILDAPPSEFSAATCKEP